jgi:hypothetical protein
MGDNKFDKADFASVDYMNQTFGENPRPHDQTKPASSLFHPHCAAVFTIP